jgi:putative transposase
MKKIFKTYKFRLYPNKEQEILLNKTFGCTRFLFNKMLAERKLVYKTLKDDKEKLYKHKYTTEKKFKSEYEWLKEADAIALQQSRVDLDTAYKNFFKSLSGKRKCKKIGFPKFRSKKDNRQTFRTINVNNNIDIVFENKKLKLPKLKWTKYSDNRQFNGIIRNVTIEKTPTGKYFACILVEEFIDTKIHQVNSDSKAIGLDYDSKNLYTSNENQVAGYPRFYRKYERKLVKEQRKLAKKQKGSSRRNTQRVKVARVHKKIVNSRKDFQQKLSTQIVKDYDIIGVETLNMIGIARSLNLAKSTLDNSWGSFVNMLEYKCEWYGKHLVFADKFYASTKTCSNCGYKNTELTLADREWDCPICHIHHNRDVNAGINLMNNAIKNTVGTTEINARGDDLVVNRLDETRIPVLKGRVVQRSKKIYSNKNGYEN